MTPGRDRAGGNTSVMVADLEGENNEYGDDAFESEDPSPARRTNGDELRQVAIGAKDSGKDCAFPALDNSSDPELELEVRRPVCAHTAHTAGSFGGAGLVLCDDPAAWYHTVVLGLSQVATCMGYHALPVVALLHATTSSVAHSTPDLRDYSNLFCFRRPYHQSLVTAVKTRQTHTYVQLYHTHLPTHSKPAAAKQHKVCVCVECVDPNVPFGPD